MIESQGHIIWSARMGVVTQ